ncbi:uncharacterized protein MJAP1_000235 [Malassezia japonica]|uniref:Uncharacterized protein n=1 Tax=Malassezia japonica TaxID=223818 RepID=A0AAF0JDV0_9BASI|nr:uncharacterized protein MJAP1_000235 [Malassezia japonica]WFD37291.1 hypothetical protein MJAP1_000235 [Malassezia japonica]
MADASESFVAPDGYQRATLAADAGDDQHELWVIRVPDEVDVSKLDGVTLPLAALQGSSRAPLASVDVGKDIYDLFSASTRRTEHGDEASQLIDMAGASRKNLFVDHDYFEHTNGVGIATDLSGIVPLLPTSSNTLRIAPKKMHRRMYMARRAPSSDAPADLHAVPHVPHVQPWERLQGKFIPMGALASKKSEKEADGDAERIKKRKKSTSESKTRKKQKA